MFRDLYGRRRVSRRELMNPTGEMPMSFPVAMPVQSMNSGLPSSPITSVSQIQRPVFENQLRRVGRPDFSNIISMLQRRRRTPPPV